MTIGERIRLRDDADGGGHLIVAVNRHGPISGALNRPVTVLLLQVALVRLLLLLLLLLLLQVLSGRQTFVLHVHEEGGPSAIAARLHFRHPLSGGGISLENFLVPERFDIRTHLWVRVRIN